MPFGNLGTRDLLTKLVARPFVEGTGTMADEGTPADQLQAGTPQAPVAVTMAPQGQPAAPTPNISETAEGGHYIVNGQHVNADGEPYKGKK